jgi:hypothetical protein
VRAKAKLGLILAAIGLPICCFPLGIVGAFIGLGATKMAKARNLSTPATAILAMIAGALSLVISTAVGIAGYMSHAAEQERLAGIADKLEGKRAEEKLEQEIACLLAEERVVGDGFLGEHNDPDGFDCSGASFEADERTAELSGITFRILDKKKTATACFARGGRWFVLKMSAKESCGTIHPPKRSAAADASEDEHRKLEDEARARQAELEAKELIAAYEISLAKIRTDAAKPLAEERACAETELDKRLAGRDALKIVTVDHALLEAAKLDKDDPWKFLTSDAVHELLGDGKARDKAEAVKKISEESADLVVVYRSEERAWPVVEVDEGVISDDFSFDTGVFLGWMMVYDLASGARLCQATVAAENSETVRFREGRFSSKRAKAEKAVFEDFTDNFKDAATARAKKLSPKIKLGYKLLE